MGRYVILKILRVAAAVSKLESSFFLATQPIPSFSLRSATCDCCTYACAFLQFLGRVVHVNDVLAMPEDERTVRFPQLHRFENCTLTIMLM